MRNIAGILMIFAMLSGVAGCTTTERSAATGGLAGAAIGGVATGKVGGAVAGGVVGALAGAVVGRAQEKGFCVYENRWGYRYRALCP